MLYEHLNLKWLNIEKKNNYNFTDTSSKYNSKCVVLQIWLNVFSSKNIY